MKFIGKNMTLYFALVFVILLWDVEICAGYEVNSIEHNQTMRISLHRQKPAWEQQMNSPLHKYGITMDWLYKERPKPTNRTNDSILLYRYLNNEFYGKIVIGHPGQTLNVAFDTTWIYTWVMSSECNFNDSEATGCKGHNEYNHRKSSEYKPNGTQFSDGNYLSGYFSYDNISIAHSNVTGYPFIEMTKVPNNMIFNKADGIMGLGLKVDSYDPFFYALLNQKKIRDPVFSIYINRNRKSPKNKGGNILLGFYDKTHIKVDVIDGKKVYDEILYLPVDPSAYWQFKMDKVMMIYNPTKNETFCPNGCKAIVDTSSSIITGPISDIATINRNIEAHKIVIQGRQQYAVDCDSILGLPKMNFVFQNKVFTFTGPKYILKVTNGSYVVCLSAFQEADEYDQTVRWVLGASFLAEVYTIYDTQQKRIGLVHAA